MVVSYPGGLYKSGSQELALPVTGGNYSSFILRLWVEPGGNWRWGIIQHVATRKKRRFSDVTEMLDFISQYSTEAEVSIPFLLDGSELMSDGDDDDPADLVGEPDPK